MATLRVVLDTNLLVSFLLTRGRTISRIIEYWENGDIIVLASPAIRAEVVEVLNRPRIRQSMIADPQPLLDLLHYDTTHTTGELVLTGVSRDPKDDKFLACAVEGTAAYIVTGDVDLLSLESFQGVAIIRPSDFVTLLDTPKSAVHF